MGRWVCGRPASGTSRSLSGAGSSATSPRLATVAMSDAAWGFGWHGGGGCSADAASGVRVATQSAASAPKVSKIGRRAVDFVLGRSISGSSLRWPASFIREEPSGPGNIPEDVDQSFLPRCSHFPRKVIQNDTAISRTSSQSSPLRQATLHPFGHLLFDDLEDGIDLFGVATQVFCGEPPECDHRDPQLGAPGEDFLDAAARRIDREALSACGAPVATLATL